MNQGAAWWQDGELRGASVDRVPIGSADLTRSGPRQHRFGRSAVTCGCVAVVVEDARRRLAGVRVTWAGRWALTCITDSSSTRPTFQRRLPLFSVGARRKTASSHVPHNTSDVLVGV
ncbi:hypothetical protein LSTR_LSTR015030 [Laodelphax striatellus]|uniref:Uncharacterized protein n=1 Tax=Laodelphax striatellus TaxID=195883 RepID=A0A482WG20_LAOST|nr:hypothetical protein LSTR_LSTR015030 [Laodelphax striatellus]